MVGTEKREIRNLIRTRLGELPPARFSAGGEAVAAALVGMPEFGSARLVLAFLSMPSELDTRPAIMAALEEGKEVGVPRIVNGEIEFVSLDKGWESWSPDGWGIPEPPVGSEPIAHSEIAAGPSLVLAPGLAFDRAGGRLGRGKGYYDRFLASIDALEPAPDRFFVLGICLSEQLIAVVPRTDGDRRMDAVLADARLFGR